jgi:hypothetical protein
VFDVFDFDLPGAVTEHLERRLNAMPSSVLTENALNELSKFQRQQKIGQGVYELLIRNEVVYVGKADDVRQRLTQHFRKLRGRQKINLEGIRYKCLLLPRSWSASANEKLLVAHYKAKGECKWNGAGFGPKDVGQKRDDTEPNWFDREYPINADYACPAVPDKVTLAGLLTMLKAELPFTLRYQIDSSQSALQIELKRVPRTARALIGKAVQALGPEWQATIFASHITLYKRRQAYRHGEIIAHP